MNNEQIRMMLLDSSTRAKVKELMVSKADELIINIIRDGSITTRKLSEKLGISNVNCATKLQALTIKGYLKRTPIETEKRSIAFLYEIADGL